MLRQQERPQAAIPRDACVASLRKAVAVVADPASPDPVPLEAGQKAPSPEGRFVGRSLRVQPARVKMAEERVRVWGRGADPPKEAPLLQDLVEGGCLRLGVVGPQKRRRKSVQHDQNQMAGLAAAPVEEGPQVVPANH